MRVDVSAPLLDRIYAHARAAFPEECCGYVRGGSELDEVVPCTNAQAEPDRDRGFAIDGGELFDFARAFDSERPPRVVYHSHPNGLAYFSDTDRAMATSAAYPVQHVVIGVTADGVTEAAQFALVDGDFVEIARWSP